ncbi:MAG: exported protein [Verrucomicrobiales bacterium]|nr:exported protein [Verrucomicrobiales bacterium]
MNFGQALVCLLSAALFVACDRKPIEVTPSGTNLTIPVTPPAIVQPPSPTQAQPKLQTIKIFLGAEELDAEMALTAEQQHIGMMFRTNHTDSDAMIFVFPSSYRASFWMKNCPESLSAAYIDPDGVIQEIHHLEQQDTNSVVATSENIQYVLEVKDGWFQRHNVNTGAVIRTEFGPLRKTFFEKR